MKSLWVYVIIGGTAFAVGASGGIVGKRVLGAVKTQYIGELELMDIEELMYKYEKNPNQGFTAAEVVNIAMEKFRRCDNNVSISKGTAKTVVSQTIRSYKIKRGDEYFEESVSKSSMVSLANRMNQTGVDGDVIVRNGKADGPESGVYPAEPSKVMSHDDYKEFMGATLDEMFIYVISETTVDYEETTMVKNSDGSTRLI